MATTSRILDIARGAMAAQNAAITTTSHNIANVNTPGYSRQRVDLTSAKPMAATYGFVGQGVDIQSIHRMRDTFVDTQLRFENQTLGRWQYRENVMVEVENIFNEPSDTGLSQILENFWDSWDELGNDPQSGSAREQVRQMGTHLVNTFQHLSKRLTDLQDRLNEDLKGKVDEINSKTVLIGELNDQIASAETRDITANEFRDQRDRLVDDLSKLVDVTVTDQDNGMITLSLSGHILVERNVAYQLSTSTGSNGRSTVDTIVWERNNRPVAINNGEVKGILELRDEIIQGKLNDLDELANSMVTQVNTLHTAGYGQDGFTGYDFFSSASTGADDIALDNGILGDITRIAASSDGTAGNGDTAHAIAGLRESRVMSGNSITMDDFYAAMMGSLGVQSQEASFMRENQDMMVTQLETQKSSVSGVSLDEEMSSLIKYQHAYDAAARLITTVDEMMQTVINMV